MKKFLVIFAFILLLTGCKNDNIEDPKEPIEKDPIVTPTEEDKKTYKKYEIIQLEENIVCKNDLIRTDMECRYWPFIYSLEEKYWNETVIGETNCQEGYFYCKDMYTGEIRQLVDEKISVYKEDYSSDDKQEVNTRLYYISNNKINRINPLGTELEILYVGKKVKESVFNNYEDLLIFVDDDVVKTLDKYTGEVIEYFTQSGIDDVRYSHYYDYITYHIGSNVYSFNRTTKEIKQITESQESGYYSKSSSPIEE